ncbi:MAG: (2Fe-2S)-binding protein [Methylococcaceae bacterium]|nr:(2Fe-2S)-binding protein [Methylococcaceae bacterium]
MIDINSSTTEDILCYCAGTTRQQIKQLLAEGVTDQERISRITGAASGCGGCEFNLQEMLAEHG